GWWFFPIFWGIVYCVGMALSAIALYQRDPAQLQGWAGIRLGALLIGNFGVYNLIAWGWLYRDRPLPAWRGPAYFSLQMLLLSLLLWWYGASFAWIALALIYPVIGGLPRRQLPLPLAVLLLAFVLGSLLGGEAGATPATLLNIFVQVIVNLGIAIFLRLMSAQRDRLRDALAELRQAHAQLAASAAQQEELAVLRERSRLARAMHDNLGHALVVMNVKLGAAPLLYARDPLRGDAELESTRELIRTTMAELRRALADLRAPASEGDDLPGALRRLGRELEARSGIAVTCDIDPSLP